MIQKFRFVNGPESDESPVSNSPSAPADLVPLSYLQANYALIQPTVVGSYAEPQAIAAGTGVEFTGSAPFNIWFIEGSGGAVTVSASKRIADGSFVGQRLKLVGCSNTNKVTIAANPGENNMELNGTWVAELRSELSLWWTGSAWKEESRSESQ